MSLISRQILLFARGDGLKREFNRIRRDRVVLVKPGPFFKQLGPHIYQINPDQPDNYTALIRSIRPSGELNVDIVHLWNLECEGIDFIYGGIAKTLRSLRQSLATGPQSVMRICDALRQSPRDGDSQVLYGHCAFETNLQPQNEITPDLHKARRGFVLKKLRFQERPTDMAALAAMIDRELAGGEPPDAIEVAYTGTFVRTADAARGTDAAGGFAALPLRREGSYWITDNSKGWGSAIAEFLTREQECDVTLIGNDCGSGLQALAGGPASHSPHGIVHCLEEDDLGSVSHNLEKTLAIDFASAEMKLDFFALLTPACCKPVRDGTFADGFVALRKHLVSLGRRQGKTRSIHWDGAGAGALRTAFTSYGEPEDLQRSLQSARTGVPRLVTKASQPIREQDVVRIMADTLKLGVREVDPDAPAVGGRLNSMLLAEFVGRLNKRFQINLAPPVFYEHKTLRSFVDFLIERYGDGTKDCFAAPPARIAAPPAKAGNADPGRGLRDVAIVGVSGIFPGSPNLNVFWRHLADGKDLVREIPAERWDWRAYTGNPNGFRATSKWGGFVDEVDAFDASFFGISPREAELMDPQQRMLIEAAWSAIEDAGHRPSSLAGTRTGVFIGATTHDYYELLTRSGHLDSHLGTGTSQSILANRLSYLLDTCGPSESIDTACSSSLVAVCRALTAIETGECDSALVGGVNALLSPSLFVALTRAGMLCEDGRCKSFSRDANGYVRGEGAGVIWMRPLDRAEADGDHIYAVVKAGAVNHGGRVNSLTVPSPEAQADAIIRCYEKANVDPSTIGYIEAHGSGTELGDPIEINGLKKAFQRLYEKWDKPAPVEPSCGVGTVKSNIGHLESAAGIAGVLKVVLALKYKTLPASLHCDSINLYIELDGSPFYIVNKPEKWKEPAGCGLRRAGVSSFGFGGVNAHILLEEAPPQLRSLAVEKEDSALVVLSAKSENRLKACAVDLLAFLDSEEFNPPDAEIRLRDLAYTLQAGREPHSERFALIVDSLADLRDKLNRFVNGGDDIENAYRGQAQRNDEAIGIIGRDEDLQRAIHDWMRKRKYADLLRLWVRGLAVDWNKLYGQDKPRRISLPTYPFARERYWFPETQNADSMNRPPADLGRLSEATGRQWFSFVEEWVASPLEIETDSWVEKIDARKGHALLVLSERGSDFEAMQAFCRELSRVSHSDRDLWEIGFHQLGEGDRSGLRKADFEPLLIRSDAPLTIFLFLSREIPPGGELLQLELAYTCVQSIVHRAATRPVQFYCCYRDLSSDQSLYLEALSGLFKSAMLETTEHRYRSISYDAALLPEESLPASLIKEWLCDRTLNMSPERVPMVRYDGSGRSELQVNESLDCEPSIPPVRFRKGATYLMVGALGEIGELICRELGRRFQSRLIVFSRRSAETARDSLSRMEAAGAAVVYRSVDILDIAALKREMRALKDGGEVIHGVIQAARRASDAPIVRKSFREFSAVMAAKVQGTMNIEALTSDEPLEFFIAFSSVASLGIKGSPDYAYSTAFQNALSRRRNVPGAQGSRPVRFRALCWGQFEKDGGVHPDRLSSRIAELAGLGIKPIDAASSIAAMEAGLCQSSSVFGLVAVHDKARFGEAMGFDREPGQKTRRILDEIDAFERGESGDSRFAGFLKTLNPDDYTDAVRKRVIDALKRAEPAACVKTQDASTSGSGVNTVPMRIAEHLAKVLKIGQETIDHAKPFQEYGLDSITAMQLSSRLEKEFQIAIQPHWLIEYPCISSFSGKLIEELS